MQASGGRLVEPHETCRSGSRGQGSGWWRGIPSACTISNPILANAEPWDANCRAGETAWKQTSEKDYILGQPVPLCCFLMTRSSDGGTMERWLKPWGALTHKLERGSSFPGSLRPVWVHVRSTRRGCGQAPGGSRWPGSSHQLRLLALPGSLPPSTLMPTPGVPVPHRRPGSAYRPTEKILGLT